ncbi:MAG TPA: hypothetical protein VNC50_20780, partial [Planctomycetia bacterium]|nr:hypothetical protein [Planctomycetia bacterium]
MPVGAIFLVTALLPVAEPPSPKRGVSISRVTTRILQPVGRDGWIDYPKAIDERLGPYDSPENAARARSPA